VEPEKVYTKAEKIAYFRAQAALKKAAEEAGEGGAEVTGKRSMSEQASGEDADVPSKKAKH